VAAGKSLIKLAVFGQPIAQSLSPLIHPQFAAQFGLEIEYRAIESSVDDFPAKVNQLADSGALGCNITAPLKRAAYDVAQERSPEAGLAQAVNTLVFRGPNDWFGTTTDGGGLLRDLRRVMANDQGFDLRDRRILIVGAGGAAAGVIMPLLQQAPACLVIANRDKAKAEALAQRFSPIGKITSCALSDSPSHGPFDLLINATSLGHQGLAPELASDCFSAHSFCYDLNYGEAAKAWESLCVQRGLLFSDGLGMLVEQAALSFELWTGHAPGTEKVLANLRDRFAAA
jgi:shikimate dehydrogenase